MNKIQKAVSIFKEEGLSSLVHRSRLYISRHLLLNLGFVGLFKSAYYSLRHTNSLYSIAIHSNTVTEISNAAEFDINSRVMFGLSRGSNYVRATKSHLKIGADGSITHTGDGLGRIGANSKISINGEFSIGDSFITSNAYIACEEYIEIGDGVAIGSRVTLMDSDYHQIVINGNSPEITSPISIQDNVWIGMDVSIKKGVSIGEGSVIASNSVVTSDIPSGVLAAGSPAQVVEENVSWE